MPLVHLEANGASTHLHVVVGSLYSIAVHHRKHDENSLARCHPFMRLQPALSTLAARSTTQ